MTLSANTMAVMLTLINLLLMSIMFYSQRINIDIPGFGWWTLGITGLCIGSIILILIYFVYSLFFFTAAYILQIAGAVSIMYGSSQFTGRPLNKKLTALLLLVFSAVTVFISLNFSFSLFYITMNIIFALIYIMGITVFIFDKKKYEKDGFAVVVPLMLLLLFHLYNLITEILYLNFMFHALSLGIRYGAFAALYGALAMTLVQQGYFKYHKDLKQKTEEKEMLFREMHHRTKNNLALVGSMVALDSMAVEDPHARDILKALQNKINTIMLLHQQLQDVETTDHVNTRDYLGLLIDSFSENRSGKNNRIAIEKDIAPIDLSSSEAIPVGLILNELITNSRKHAFPGSSKGKIQVQLKQDNGKIFIKVADNGKGLSEKPRDGSNGLSLVKSLTKQVNGDFSIENNKEGNGTKAELVFPVETK